MSNTNKRVVSSNDNSSHKKSKLNIQRVRVNSDSDNNSSDSSEAIDIPHHDNNDNDDLVLRCIALRGAKSIAFREIVVSLDDQCTPEQIEQSIISLNQQHKLYMYPDYQGIRGKYFRMSSNCEDILSDESCEDCGELCILGCKYCSECTLECYNCGLKYDPIEVENCHAPVGNTTCPCKLPYCEICMGLHEELVEKWYVDKFHEDDWRENPQWKTAGAWVKALRPIMKRGIWPTNILYPDCDFLVLSRELEELLP